MDKSRGLVGILFIFVEVIDCQLPIVSAQPFLVILFFQVGIRQINVDISSYYFTFNHR
uniref:Similar to phage L54a excisionase: SwissProt Accession Number P20710 n=1 Tax=Lactococcus phage mv4 TaxID=12392 RepID=Q37955_BPMV4|nr:ORFI3; similar to phage L54a excisionase: SwissProt Accession Number P20710 [Lactobacillus phage mv4]prf//2104328B ORF I3 [Lactobacillus phage mv4]